MFDLLPPLDVSDPRAFMAAAAAIFASYPAEVWASVIDPVRGLPGRTARPTLADIKAACDEAYEPIDRLIDRQRSQKSDLRGLPPPRAKRTAEEQARIDAQVERVRRMFPPVERGYIAATELAAGDGRHAQRIAADLEARRARNVAREAGEDAA
ncbi:MAG: hypothetical protein IT537_03395 [Hyphomicrobiales bacterium]|nr:hypothetical protein [Hyphomicrobiales bacterium]